MNPANRRPPGKRKLERPEGQAYTERVEAIKSACHAGALSIGDTVRALRDLTGLSQKEYAARIGMSRSTLSAIENDQRSPSLAAIEQALRPFAFELRVVPKSGADMP